MSAAPRGLLDALPEPTPEGGDVAGAGDVTGLNDIAARCELPCHLADPELFFAELPSEVEKAKALCTDCPIRAACLQAAIERREPWGVWGGQLIDNGVVVPRKKPRGRPRKVDLLADQQLVSDLVRAGLPVRAAGTAA